MSAVPLTMKHFALAELFSSARRGAGSVSRIPATTHATMITASARITVKMPRHPIGSTRNPPIIGAITGAMPPTIIMRLNARAATCRVPRRR